MRFKRLLPLIWALGLVATASAHDLFLKLDTYFLQPNSTAAVRLLNGTFKTSEGLVARDRLRDVSVIGPEVTKSGADSVGWRDEDQTTLMEFETGAPGTYVAAISTKPREIDLKAAQFNDYLQHDGIPDMIEQARKRLGSYLPDRVMLYVGDAAAVNEPDASFDGVFDFGIIHHIPNWKDAIAEVARVLRPGGKFFFEEVTSHALGRWFYRKFLKHPDSKHWFGKEQFITELEDRGITVAENIVERFFGDFIVGVGCRAN